MDKIILQGDQVMFQPTMGAATLIGNLSIPINGSGTMTVTGKKVCLEGKKKSTAAD